MDRVFCSIKIINSVNTLVIALAASLNFLPSFVQADSNLNRVKTETQNLGVPVLVDSNQLKKLVKDVNEFSGKRKSQHNDIQHSDKDEISIYEAEELYIVKVLDPYAGVNRVFSDVNAQVYRIIKTPADFYSNSSVLVPVRLIFTGAGNIISNLDELLIGTTSNLVTGNFEDAGISAGRSIFNMAFGLGGAIDTASILASEPVTDGYALKNMDVAGKVSNSLSFGLEFLKQAEIHSFNDVLRNWGFGCGFYLVFPLIGPQTARQVTASIAELPLRVDSYVMAASILRVASVIDHGLKDADSAKYILSDIDLATETGKIQFYAALRTASLSINKCINDEEVRKFAEKEGKIISDEYD